MSGIAWFGRYQVGVVGVMVVCGWSWAVRPLLAQPAMGEFIYLEVPEEVSEVYFFQQVQLPPTGKILRAWTAAAATHEFVLYINGREACRSR